MLHISVGDTVLLSRANFVNIMFPTTTITNNLLPATWANKNYEDGGSYLVPLSSSSESYARLTQLMKSELPGKPVLKIDRVQNPFLYAQFLLKKEEYKSRNINFTVKEILHDTAEHNVESIVRDNFDWRMTSRALFGRGVSFSPSANYANRQSSRRNGIDRAMIVAEVLVGRLEPGRSFQELPCSGDTTTGNGTNVYVKYYDDEFYPKYVIYYKNDLFSYGNSRLF